MSDDDTDDGGGSDGSSKPHLDPRAVTSLAESIPNCSRVSPPGATDRPGRDGGGSATDGGGRGRGGTEYGRTRSKSESAPSSSYFSSFSRRLQLTFSNDEKQLPKGGDEGRREETLSFLVSDVHSIERLAAAADGEGKHASTSELEGAGVARIDVYCRTGTVITCRVIPTAAADPADEKKEDETDSSGRSASFMQMLPTPRKGNVSEKESNTQEGTQVRRIIRRKCTIDALRKIFEEPPRLPEINESIIAYDPFADDDENSKESDGDDSDTEDDSHASTVSKLLRKRQQKRLKKKNKKFSKLSKEQRTFLKAQQKKYEKRMRRDEKVRRHVGNAILAAGMGGCTSEMGVDLTAMRSLSLDDTTVTSGGIASGSDVKSLNNDDANGTNGEEGDAYDAQKAIQDKIEIADMGLAILMGEAQRLERIMAGMRERRDRDADTDASTVDSRGSKDVDTDTDTTVESKRCRIRDSDSRGSRNSRRSFSSAHSTDRDAGDDTTVTSVGSDSLSDGSSTEERKLARLMQGCEVEYSFPHDYHDELEGALMNEEISEDSQSSEDDDDNSDDDSEDAPARKRRGRSPPKDGPKSPTNAASKKKKLDASPIVAIPTNGEGCVVLRENGAFDVVGKIPEVLRKKLFRSKGPMPDQVALGTLGRYYVHFTDGSFFFYGPPSLSKILIKGNKKQRRGKDRNRGKRGDVSVVSVAFGKKLDDFFVVRSDGSWETNGSMPPGLEGLMKDRRGRADLLWVALGANGEWCVRSRHGRVWWEGVSDEADEALADILAEDGENELKFIDFGKDDTYFLLHK